MSSRPSTQPQQRKPVPPSAKPASSARTAETEPNAAAGAAMASSSNGAGASGSASASARPRPPTTARLTASTKHIQSLTADQLLRMRAASRKLIPRDLVADKYIPTLSLRNARMLQFPNFSTLNAIDRRAEAHDVVDPRSRALERGWTRCTYPNRDPQTLRKFDMVELMRLPNPTTAAVQQNEFLAASGALRAVKAIRAERDEEQHYMDHHAAAAAAGTSMLGATYRSETMRRTARQLSPNASGSSFPPPPGQADAASSSRTRQQKKKHQSQYELAVSRLQNMRFAFCNDFCGAPVGAAAGGALGIDLGASDTAHAHRAGDDGGDGAAEIRARATLFTLRFVPEYAAFHIEHTGVVGVGAHSKHRNAAAAAMAATASSRSGAEALHQQSVPCMVVTQPPRKKGDAEQRPHSSAASQSVSPLVWTIEAPNEESEQSKSGTSTALVARSDGDHSLSASANHGASAAAAASEYDQLLRSHIVLRPRVVNPFSTSSKDDQTDVFAGESKEAQPAGAGAEDRRRQQHDAFMRQLWVLQPLYGGIPAGAEHFASAALLGVEKMTLSRSQRYEISPLVGGNKAVVEVNPCAPIFSSHGGAATHHHGAAGDVRPKSPSHSHNKPPSQQRARDTSPPQGSGRHSPPRSHRGGADAAAADASGSGAHSQPRQRSPKKRDGAVPHLMLGPRRDVPLPLSVFAVARDVRCVRAENTRSIPRIAYHFEALAARRKQRSSDEEAGRSARAAEHAEASALRRSQRQPAQRSKSRSSSSSSSASSSSASRSDAAASPQDQEPRAASARAVDDDRLERDEARQRSAVESAELQDRGCIYQVAESDADRRVNSKMKREGDEWIQHESVERDRWLHQQEAQEHPTTAAAPSSAEPAAQVSPLAAPQSGSADRRPSGSGRRGMPPRGPSQENLLLVPPVGRDDSDNQLSGSQPLVKAASCGADGGGSTADALPSSHTVGASRASSQALPPESGNVVVAASKPDAVAAAAAGGSPASRRRRLDISDGDSDDHLGEAHDAGAAARPLLAGGDAEANVGGGEGCGEDGGRASGGSISNRDVPTEEDDARAEHDDVQAAVGSPRGAQRSVISQQQQDATSSAAASANRPHGATDDDAWIGVSGSGGDSRTHPDLQVLYERRTYLAAVTEHYRRDFEAKSGGGNVSEPLSATSSGMSTSTRATSSGLPGQEPSLLRRYRTELANIDREIEAKEAELKLQDGEPDCVVANQIEPDEQDYPEEQEL